MLESPVFWILAACGLFSAMYGIVQYNALLALRNHIRESWSNIDTELKRRYELVPNLVAVVKGYAAHEREVLERVTELRARALANHGAPAAQAADEKQLVEALRGMMVVVERYPALKADRHFLELQRELVNTEDRIQAARRFFNGNVRDYQVRCQSFPSNLVARAFGFEPEGYFTVDRAVDEAPHVTLAKP